MSTCARCGADDCLARGTAETTAEDVIACRDRQIAAQAALLRSVTGKLEEAGGAIERVRDGLDGSDPIQWDLQQEADLALRDVRAVLEILS